MNERVTVEAINTVSEKHLVALVESDAVDHIGPKHDVGERRGSDLPLAV